MRESFPSSSTGTINRDPYSSGYDAPSLFGGAPATFGPSYLDSFPSDPFAPMPGEVPVNQPVTLDSLYDNPATGFEATTKTPESREKIWNKVGRIGSKAMEALRNLTKINRAPKGVQAPELPFEPEYPLLPPVEVSRPTPAETAAFFGGMDPRTGAPYIPESNESTVYQQNTYSPPPSPLSYEPSYSAYSAPPVPLNSYDTPLAPSPNIPAMPPQPEYIPMASAPVAEAIPTAYGGLKQPKASFKDRLSGVAGRFGGNLPGGAQRVMEIAQQEFGQFAEQNPEALAGIKGAVIGIGTEALVGTGVVKQKEGRMRLNALGALRAAVDPTGAARRGVRAGINQARSAETVGAVRGLATAGARYGAQRVGSMVNGGFGGM